MGSEASVKTLIIICIAATGTALSACGKASASVFDPANPLHCAAQFESYSIIARRQGQEGEARGLSVRSQWYAQRARSLSAEQLTRAALNELGNKIVAQPDGGLALATECLKRQDADPDVQRLVQKAKKALSEGLPPTTPISKVP